MFYLLTCEDIVRIPPEKFGLELKQVALEELTKRYEGFISRDLSYIIAITSVEPDMVGKILPGDGATYHSVSFSLLVYKAEIQEIVEGEIIEIGDFGAFIRIGPVEALLHISQVMDDYITYDERQGTLTGKETRRKLMRGDKVRVRVTAVSMSKGGASSKIGVTMRQPFLGKLEWIKEDVRRLEAGAKSAKRAEVATP